MVPTGSLTVGGIYGFDDRVIVSIRIAGVLSIRDGDVVDVLFDDVGETFPLRVRVRDELCGSDILIHDFVTLGLADAFKMSKGGNTFTLSTGQTLPFYNQEMWSTMRIAGEVGAARLFFDGASKNNPSGPAGFGFHIERETSNGDIHTLVQGFRYTGMNHSSNEMEYC